MLTLRFSQCVAGNLILEIFVNLTVCAWMVGINYGGRAVQIKLGPVPTASSFVLMGPVRRRNCADLSKRANLADT